MPARPAARLERVECSANRVIRTITGLRPYRPSGYVVRRETRGSKTIIHNYGHGGAGITMSWGTALLAVEEALRSGHRDYAVLGCGVIGLSTAILLQQRGLRATIYSKLMPPETTSNVAGGFWSPVTLFESGRQSKEFSANYVRAARFAHSRFQSLAGPAYGVRWLPIYSLRSDPPPNAVPPPAAPPPPNPFPEIAALFPAGRTLEGADNPFPALRARVRYSLLIEPAIYLRALLQDFQIAGGRIAIRDFQNVSEVLSLGEPAIVNCTGLGAKALFQDDELTPVKGQLSFLIPQPEVNYCTIGPGDLYMFPRHDGILLGGTHEEGNWSLDVDAAQTERIVSGHAALFSAMR